MAIRNPNKIATTKKKDAHDPWMELVTHLRKKGPEVRNAVMSGVRVDFFRGKDLMEYLKDNQDIMQRLPPDNIKGNKVEEQVELVVLQLLRKGVIFRADRTQKIPKPGKKLLKYPKRLEMHPDGMCFSVEGFYVWRFSLPASPWTYLGSALLVVVTIACCLFPLAPHWVKLAVLYMCLCLLGLIFVVCIVRGMVFGIIWVLFGKHLWLLPNLFSDDMGIVDAFSPWYEVEEVGTVGRGEEQGGPPSLTSRLLAAVATAATLYFLYTASPETDQMAAATRSAHKSILQMLDLYEVPKQLEGGNSTNTTELVNATVNQSDANSPKQVDDEIGSFIPLGIVEHMEFDEEATIEKKERAIIDENLEL
mmetsp:Transcript_22466/g.31238  ORF Transcript_22466/g.31238 Transcript_22466/m.31238 type:complete len:363 (+) Transcript_22466:177-1265(+)|eukprot:CAMPEP_0196572848 /NCGR_PEP_ID=MMETSP1081-20130531/2829_1 /TAXON_ID=36882 /ORGANISM="Pyramimonas amylifera, Strain CCMP720" /LENGTH=362 /DNA_ID=CAMNT_0041890315 /DNA_START=156 /DNA_END=1244 /DNA_ORIENTATION=-